MLNTKSLFAGLLLALVATESFADDDYLPPVSDPVVRTVCGECHMAFPPGFLPARSWGALMAGLNDHFGEDIRLSSDQARHIEDYLTRHASDGPKGHGLHDFMRWIAPEGTPKRITENPAFLHEHRLPDRVWRDPKVVTKSNCPACHLRAEDGWFDD
jgi:Dihaem cytochrome c.